MGEFKLTPAQVRFLAVLHAAPRVGLPGGVLAVEAGYKGKSHQPGGGAGRAPMWAGRVYSGMPDGLVRLNFDGGCTRYSLTERGFALACRLVGDAA